MKSKNLDTIILFSFIILTTFFYEISKNNTYLILTFFFIIILLCLFFFFLQKKIIYVMIFVLIFLSGDYRNLQKKYFKWFSLMHWNDGVKIFLSVPKRFIYGDYLSRIEYIFKYNYSYTSYKILSDLNISVKKNNLDEILLSSKLEYKFKKSQDFRYRMAEGIYPVKIRLSHYQKSNYFLYSLINEEKFYSKKCIIIDKTNELILFKC